MSPRAACRLEQLGFPEVYDYTAGKADWLAHGLETEGEQAGVLRARHAVRADVVTASIEEPWRLAHRPCGLTGRSRSWSP